MPLISKENTLQEAIDAINNLFPSLIVYSVVIFNNCYVLNANNSDQSLIIDLFIYDPKNKTIKGFNPMTLKDPSLYFEAVKKTKQIINK